MLLRRFAFFLLLAAVPALPQPAPLSGFADDGVFHLYLNEDRLGTMKFRCQQGGAYGID